MINRSIIVGSFFSWLFLFSIIPPILVAIEVSQGQPPSSLESFIVNNQATLTSIGTIFLVAAVGILTTSLANISGERRDRAMRSTQSQIKIDEFRQSWIDRTLEEMTTFSRLVGTHGRDTSNAEIFATMTKLRIRLNHEDALVSDLVDAMTSCIDAIHADDTNARHDAVAKFIVASHYLLKDEWKRLKLELIEAIQSEEVTP